MLGSMPLHKSRSLWLSSIDSDSFVIFTWSARIPTTSKLSSGNFLVQDAHPQCFRFRLTIAARNDGRRRVLKKGDRMHTMPVALFRSQRLLSRYSVTLPKDLLRRMVHDLLFITWTCPTCLADIRHLDHVPRHVASS